MELLAARIALDELPLEQLRAAAAELLSDGLDDTGIRIAADPATPPWHLEASLRRALEARGLVLERRRAFVVLSLDIARQVERGEMDAEQGARRMRVLGDRIAELLQLAFERPLLPSQGGRLPDEPPPADHAPEIDLRFWDYFGGAALEFEEIQGWSGDQVRLYREIEARVLELARLFIRRYG
jgi:hypothetical protein